MRTATFALFVGIAFLSAGLLGLMPAALTPPPAEAPPVRLTLLYGYLLGLFPVNVVHSAIHLAIGAWGIYAWRAEHFGGAMASPKLFARALAILYAALAVIGVVPGMGTLFGLVPVHGNDVWLHAGTAALAAYFGWRSESWVERRAAPVTDRRQEIRPVQSERRIGHADRRVPGSEV
jgi:hypothetical protein